MRIQAARLVGGKGQGPALVSSTPISFLGGVSPTTGEIMDTHSPVFGANVSGKILVFPGGKGSTVGSYVLYGLARRGRAPAAIVVEKADTIVTVGAVIGNITAIYGVPPDVFMQGEWAEVDGEKATVRIRNVTSYEVVTCFLRSRGKILLLKRSARVGTYRGAWAGVSGYVESDEVPLERALMEMKEEVGVTSPTLAATGRTVYARDGTQLFVIHPFLFDVDNRDVRLDWEHSEYRWIRPSDIPLYEGVPKLADTFRSAAAGSPSRAVRGKRSERSRGI